MLELHNSVRNKRQTEAELVSGCGRELWLNPRPLAVSAAVSTGRGVRLRLGEADVKPTPRHDILFSRAAPTQTPSLRLVFLVPAEKGVDVENSPDVREVPSLLIHATFRLF